MKPLVSEINVETGESFEREMSDQEFAEYEQNRKKAEADFAEMQKKQVQREAARQSALEKLAALGLTEAEIQALAG